MTDDAKTRRPNKLAQRLLGQTANLESNVSNNPAAPISSQRNVTMPGQLGAFRLEAQKYQARIDALEQQLAEASARQADPSTSSEETEALRAQLVLLQQESTREVEALKAALDEQALTVGKPFEAPLDKIVKVPGRQRILTTEEKAALFANLDKNKMVTPVTLRPLPGGRYEMVSGHNRYDYRVERGLATIASVLDYSGDEHAERDAFFANLLQNTLPDYAKYVGFKRFMEQDPSLTVAELARDSGLPRTSVANLMVFGELPAAGRALLDAHQDKLGRNAASELASLTAKGHEDAVVAAIEAIVKGSVNQADGVAMAEKIASDKSAAAASAGAPAAVPKKAGQRGRSDAVLIRSGRHAYCSVHAAKKVLRLEFTTEDDAGAAAIEINRILQQLANASKK